MDKGIKDSTKEMKEPWAKYGHNNARTSADYTPTHALCPDIEVVQQPRAKTNSPIIKAAAQNESNNGY